MAAARRTRYRIRITESAAEQVRAAHEWWQQNRPAAPHAIREDVASAFALLSVQPHVGARAGSPRLTGVRRVLLTRISYHLYYRVLASERAIEVLAFWHASRQNEP